MLPKKQRLSTKEFQAVFSSGQSFHGKFFMMKCLPSKVARFSFVISKKIKKTAVERNKFRRRGYATIAPFVKTFLNNRNKPCECLFFYKKEALKATFSETNADINGLLKYAGILPKN